MMSIEIGVWRVLVMGMTVLLACVAGGAVLSVAARAEGCSAAAEQVRGREAYALRLPDCRAYEQVSPVGKNGVDAVGQPWDVQASLSGGGVTYFSTVPFPGLAGTAGYPNYLGLRHSEGWSYEGLVPKIETTALSGEQVVGLTEDLAKTILFVEEPPLAPNAYVRDNATGAFQLLASGTGQQAPAFADATPGGSRILFEAAVNLTTTNVVPATGFDNLYEWDEAKPPGERLSLAGVLPDGKAPKQGSVAGPGGPAIPSYAPSSPGGSLKSYYTQHTISEDGSRVFFSDSETGRIYMREPRAEPAVTVPISKGQAFWRAATPDGSYVFYTEGNELYRFNTNSDQEDILTSGAEGVLGVLGVSDDGSYAYFVAPGKLASNKNGHGEEAETGKRNLYEWHEGALTFISRLSELEAGTRDSADWVGQVIEAERTGPSGGERSSRVTPDGRTVLFSSVARLTSYNNNGNTEFYLYDAEQPLSAGNPVCVSCNPRVSLATEKAQLAISNETITASVGTSRNAFMTHNLSDDGGRVFFETEEALVPADTNGKMDVYEWEREGVGSCEHGSVSFSESNGGCLYLISTGQNDQPSLFGDASADGSSVFFFTRQSLVSQDQDNNADVYDARVGGGMLAQNPPPALSPCAGETCRGAPSVPPVLGALSSTTLSGAGNLIPQPEINPKVKSKSKARPCGKHYVRKHNRCVRAKAKRKRAKAGRAGGNRRAGS